MNCMADSYLYKLFLTTNEGGCLCIFNESESSFSAQILFY